MKKLLLSFCVMAIVVFSLSSVYADTAVVSAAVPSPIDIRPATTRVDVTVAGDGTIIETWPTTPVTPSHTIPELGFGTLTYQSGTTAAGVAWAAFFSNRYYAMDFATIYGTGTATTITSILFNYAEGSSPVGAVATLGERAGIVFVRKEIGADGKEVLPEAAPLYGGKKLLLLTGGQTVNLITDISGGWLRVYVGLLTGDPNATVPDPAGSAPFNPGDVAGNYTGTLIVTYF